MLDSAEEQLAALLTGAIAQLDIPPHMYRQAVDKYQSVARYLGVEDEKEDRDLLIYPQGSFRLGTVIRPTPNSDYDIDLVLRVSATKEQTTQAGLKEFAGQRLGEYAVHSGTGVDLTEGSRCWTLQWPSFHVDVLPALPSPENPPTGIWLTDRDLYLWQCSDPIGFAAWFHDQMRDQFIRRRALLADERAAQIDDVPAWEVKTTLQQAVQVLKRHRDIYFVDRQSLKPASILVTTIAGRAYGQEDNLFEAVLHIASHMTQFVENRNGVRWVANPVLPLENFADRWKAHPERARAFFEWVAQLQRDLNEAAGCRGLDNVVERLNRSFGSEVRKSAQDLGQAYRSSREGGKLASAAATGGLVMGSARPAVAVRPHNFYGRA
ncbi:nucleotidyltransferase [Candidatus Poriferisodalis sp.]|uniref:nucleotidyltransferase domain-containing protein n=1 Tax=Candidatus Poriferisodalis sp. TaxID=3101277 RepID=UPI003B52F897